MADCGDVMPDSDPAVTCIFPPGPHLWHGDGLLNSWKDREVAERVERAPKNRNNARQTMIAVATSAAPQTHVNPLNDGRTKDYEPVIKRAKKTTNTAGAPVEALLKWQKTEWHRTAMKTLHEYLLHHPDLFTTAEDIWPLIDNPIDGDKRQMSSVTKAAVSAGWMVHEGNRDLFDLYHTRDGFEFRQNKAARLYRSLIYTGVPAR